MVLAVALAAPAAQAQLIGGGANSSLFSGGKAKGSTEAPPPPSALPGARANKAVAPSAVNPSAMNPTAALFDAINRDDLAAARDALNRGAELRAHNVLGMTPLQLSIDLGRNDITFLLLSMRAGDDERAAPPSGVAASGVAASLPGAGKLAKGSTVPAAVPARLHRAHARVAARVARGAAPPVPTRFAGNGGTPVPSAGFLGFDPTR